MKLRRVLSCFVLGGLLASPASAAFVTLTDFESAPVGVISRNPQTIIQDYRINTNSVQGGDRASIVDSLAIAGNRSLAVIGVAAATGETYRGVGEINYQTLLDRNFDTNNPLIELTLRYDRTDPGTGTYNSLRLVGNNNLGNTYEPLGTDIQLGAGTGAVVTGTINIQTLVNEVNAAGGNGAFAYNTIRLILNKNTNNAGTLYIDNIRINTVTAVPEPGSMALLALGAVAVPAVRRRIKSRRPVAV